MGIAAATALGVAASLTLVGCAGSARSGGPPEPGTSPTAGTGSGEFTYEVYGAAPADHEHAGTDPAPAADPAIAATDARAAADLAAREHTEFVEGGCPEGEWWVAEEDLPVCDAHAEYLEDRARALDAIADAREAIADSAASGRADDRERRVAAEGRVETTTAAWARYEADHAAAEGEYATVFARQEDERSDSAVARDEGEEDAEAEAARRAALSPAERAREDRAAAAEARRVAAAHAREDAAAAREEERAAERAEAEERARTPEERAEAALAVAHGLVAEVNAAREAHADGTPMTRRLAEAVARFREAIAALRAARGAERDALTVNWDAACARSPRATPACDAATERLRAACERHADEDLAEGQTFLDYAYLGAVFSRDAYVDDCRGPSHLAELDRGAFDEARAERDPVGAAARFAAAHAARMATGCDDPSGWVPNTRPGSDPMTEMWHTGSFSACDFFDEMAARIDRAFPDEIPRGLRAAYATWLRAASAAAAAYMRSLETPTPRAVRRWESARDAYTTATETFDAARAAASSDRSGDDDR